MLAKDYPEFCVASVAKSASLRNSYQNRPPIGLSLLWAFGQGGLTDFAVGLKGIFIIYIFSINILTNKAAKNYVNINYKYYY